MIVIEGRVQYRMILVDCPGKTAVLDPDICLALKFLLAGRRIALHQFKIIFVRSYKKPHISECQQPIDLMQRCPEDGGAVPVPVQVRLKVAAGGQHFQDTDKAELAILQIEVTFLQPLQLLVKCFRCATHELTSPESIDRASVS